MKDGELGKLEGKAGVLNTVSQRRLIEDGVADGGRRIELWVRDIRLADEGESPLQQDWFVDFEACSLDHDGYIRVLVAMDGEHLARCLFRLLLAGATQPFDLTQAAS